MVGNFRFDISFLRALSVIAVVFYHFNIKYFSGGFIGVDIFFVISGFLMTKIILSGFTKQNFNLLEFYQKRASRIIPALLALIAIVGILVYIFLAPQFLTYSKSAYSSTLFFSNIQYYLNAGYFDPSSHTNFLLHTWSLSVEWQFYLVFPLLLMLFKKQYLYKKNAFKITFIALIAISFALMLYHRHYDKSYSFYIFYPRAWEMMCGGLAFLFADYNKMINRNIKAILSIVFIALLFYSIYYAGVYNNSWPRIVTIIPVLATTGLLFVNFEWKIYKNKILNFIGNTSYSWYLWHWPIYVFALFFSLPVERIRFKILLLIVTFALASFSYIFVERKKIEIVLIRNTTIAIYLVFLATYFLPSNFFMHDKLTASLSYNNEKYLYSEQMIDQYNLNTTNFNIDRKFKDYDFSYIEPLSGKKNIVLLGDSHAGMFSKIFNEKLTNENYNIIQITANATFPMLNSETIYPESAKFFNYIYNQYFPKNHQNISAIIISVNYIGYGNKLQNNIRVIENYFLKYNIPTIYLGQLENYRLGFPTEYYLNEKYNIKLNPVAFNENFLKNELKSKYISIINLPVKKIDDRQMPYIHDGGHLTYSGSKQYMPYLIKLFKEKKIIE